MKASGAMSAAMAAPDERPQRILSFFEFWPDYLFYAPVVVQWIALGLRYGDFSLPTAANPMITAGGLCGESKLEILDLVSGPARDLLARYTSSVPDGRDLAADIQAAQRAIDAAGLDYPLIAKPDIGCNGTGVRFISNQIELQRYLADFPPGERVILQEFVPEAGEAGIFYVRPPGEEVGRVTSITLKHAPVVIGDGRSTLQQLVLADPRARRVPQLYLPRLEARLHEIPQAGEQVRLVFVGNHCKGSIFRDGTPLVTPALTASFERIARAIPEFHFGRIDVRFESLPTLLRGDGFRIIEINGAGSEATHIWDPATTLRAAWRTQFWHYGQAFRIGAANRARGHRSSGLRALFALWRRQKRLMAAYPMND